MKDDDRAVLRGGDNPFQDVGLRDADTLLIKAAELAGVAEADISRIRRASLDRFTIDGLVRVLNRLDRQVYSLTTFEKVEPGR